MRTLQTAVSSIPALAPMGYEGEALEFCQRFIFRRQADEETKPTDVGTQAGTPLLHRRLKWEEEFTELKWSESYDALRMSLKCAAKKPGPRLSH
ncbi:uncharacterized protein [Macaca nemestrina]|uniref:uncharacterized protein isoform X5 n=1 Tax=Macaca fascicularis TaxID=9541 RepID=UPI001E2572C3|nr:uncharacterized protein LOC123570063 isoform X4 [Macaca fascicularis]XP_045234141.1 uncharacterized protein LOC123570063 isoform X4 [Macaca fascicularis]XP_045234142.1 uncharacterized protein LOC123570063 isoform X4 [Macaca fascicularis]XP_045234143.1 uncharacterized protein LOC123570063 isoform X4 [Macaca fascicularis]